jgi:hypothetical protein
VKLTTHLHLVQTLRMRGAIPPLSQYAFMAWCSVKAQGQLYLYLFIPCFKKSSFMHSSKLNNRSKNIFRALILLSRSLKASTTEEKFYFLSMLF